MECAGQAALWKSLAQMGIRISIARAGLRKREQARALQSPQAGGRSQEGTMKTLTIMIMMLALAAPAGAQTPQWPFYTKDYRQAFKGSFKAGGVASAAWFGTLMAESMWITDRAARALTSMKIDQERLSNEEADAYYHSLRPDGKYVVAIMTSDDAGLSRSPLRTSPLDYKGRPEPLDSKAIFLQRANDREAFSRGTLGECEYDFKLFRGPGHRDLCFVTFDRKMTAGADLVTSLDDKIEVQFTIEKRTW